MNPQEIAQLKADVDRLKKIVDSLYASATIPFMIDRALTNRFELYKFPKVDQSVAQGLATAPLGAITAPSGGATIDSQARTAINTIIARLQSLGLTL